MSPQEILWDFEVQIDHKRACHLEYFAIPEDYRVKMKENKKIEELLDFVRELRKLWNKMTVISVVVGALGTVPKGLEKRQGEQRKKQDHPDHSTFKIS